MTTYRYKIARLRGILLSAKFALRGESDDPATKDSVPLSHREALEDRQELLDGIEEVLRETADLDTDPEVQRPLPWRQGCVEQRGEYVKLYVGQIWELAEETMVELLEGHSDRSLSYETIKLRVVSTAPDGEVHLRPIDEAAVQMSKRFYPERDFVKGSTYVPPFKIVDEKMVRTSKGVLQAGDLLVHEAWGVWNEKMVSSKWTDPAG